MIKIAFAGAFAGRLAEPVRAYMTVPHEIIAADEAAIIPQLGDVDVLVSLAFSREMGSAAPRLKLVQVPGAGLDRIDRTALAPGTLLANAYGHETGISEYVIGAMLYLARDLGRLDGKLRKGEWESQWAVGTPAPPPWHELAGKTLGILGYGRIGQAVARRAQAFDMEVRAIRHHPDRTTEYPSVHVAGPEALDDVLRQADYLAITLSLTGETRGLIGKRELGLMKRSARLINVARGEIVDQAALFHALSNNVIAGAALDVWYRYPKDSHPTLPGDFPFHQLANILMTPHVSGWTEGMLQARSKIIAENAARTVAGVPPINLIPR
jgi:phosphoglycerate dehydrogenase-like enzyme